MIRITLFTTGGTIDGADSDRGTLRSTSDAAKWLKNQKDIQLTEKSLFNKDSREITERDRCTIIDAVQTCENDFILITHGTFTIAETGKSLKKEISELNKTVFLIGAWIPFAETNSDADSQMSFALSQLKDAPKGIYIAMDGKLWDPNITIKREIGPGKFKLEEVRV